MIFFDNLIFISENGLATMLVLMLYFFSSFIFPRHIKKETFINFVTIHVFLGVILNSSIFFILGILGILNSSTIVLSSVSFFILGLCRFIKNYNITISFKDKYRLFFYIISFIIAIPLFSIPEGDWDSNVYHIPIIVEFIKSHIINIYPENEAFNFPFNFNLSYVPFVLFEKYHSIKIFNYLLFLLSSNLLFDSYKFFLKNKGLKLFVPTYLLTFSYFFYGISAQLEIPLMSFVNLGIYFYIKKKNYFKYYVLISLFMAGIKISGLLIFLIEMVFFLYNFFIQGKRYISFSFELSFKVIGILLIFQSSFWYIKNTLYFNNLFYPKVQVGFFPSKNVFYELKDRVLQKLDNSELMNKKETPLIKIVNLAFDTPIKINKDLSYHSWLDIIKNPDFFAYANLNEFNFIYLYGIFFFNFKNKKVLFLYLRIILFIIITIKGAHLTRYFIPIHSMLLIVTFSNIILFRNKIIYYIIIIYLSTINVKELSKSFQLIENYKAKDFLLGGITQDEYFNKYLFYGGSSGSEELINSINSLTNIDNGTVLLIGEAKGLYIKNMYIPDQDQFGRQAIPWLRVIDNSQGDFNSIQFELKRNKIKYIGVNLEYYNRFIYRAKLYEHYNLNNRILDGSETLLLRKTLENLIYFVDQCTENIYFNEKEKIFLYKIIEGLCAS